MKKEGQESGFCISNEEKIDQQIVELCKIINEFPGVKTCFSCSGHGKSEFYLVMDFTNSNSIQKITKAFTLDDNEEICYMINLSNKEKAKILKDSKDNIYHYMYRCELMPLYVGYGKNIKTKIRLRIGNIGLGLMKNSKRRKKEIDRITCKLINYLDGVC